LQTSSADYIVQLASSGLIGLQCMRQDKPDVVITDIMMPDLDGLMLRQQMKTDPALKHIPVIAVSARGMVDTIVPLVQGTIFISKQEGFQPIELVNCVEAVVENLTLISVPE
jgi:CheY-like chemotaxis protein